MSKKSLQWNALDNKIEFEDSSNRVKIFTKKRKIYFLFLLAIVSTSLQFVCLKSCSSFSNNQSHLKYAVVVTTKLIPMGDTLNENNTKLSYLDLGESKNKFLLNSEFRSYLGHKVKIEFQSGIPILKDFVVKSSLDISLPEKIPQGKRFYTLDVNLNSISSLIKVGDIVDILAHINIKGYGKATETILNHVKIIGIGNNFEENSTNLNGNTLSFYLTPEEVKIISFMKSYSQFNVVLRNPNDFEETDSDSITFNKFIQNEKIQKIFQSDSFKIIQGETVR